MAKAAFRAQMETLEPRETPATFSGIHALAASAVFLNGSGTGQVTSEVPTSTSLTLTANLSGTDAREGAFTGTVMGQISISSKGPSSATGTATLTVAPTETIDLSLSGKLRVPKRSAVATGTFTFNVVEGTGVLAGATGNGTGTGTLNTTTGALTFRYHGRLRP
jgi:hypothetical protein